MPSKNWEVGVKNKIMLAGPMPIILKPIVTEKATKLSEFNKVVSKKRTRTFNTLCFDFSTYLIAITYYFIFTISFI